jgi:hypothetical protein
MQTAGNFATELKFALNTETAAAVREWARTELVPDPHAADAEETAIARQVSTSTRKISTCSFAVSQTDGRNSASGDTISLKGGGPMSAYGRPVPDNRSLSIRAG